MKNLFLTKNWFAFLTITFALFVIFSIGSCARKMTFKSSKVVPAATGTVKIKKGNNNNYNVEVRITNLAKPEKLTPPRNVYVVWMNTAQNQVRNIGMIKSSSGLISSTLKGKLEATSTSRPTSFFITAEDDGNVQYPGNEVVLRTN